MEWVAPDVEPAAAGRVLLGRLLGSGQPVLAPRLLIAEVSNALLTGVRRGRWPGAEADSARLVLGALPIEFADVAADLDRAWELARRFDDHPIYDMVYVALAERHETQLITADARLRRRLVGLDWVVGPEAVAG